MPTPVPIQGGGSLTINRYAARPFTNFDRLVRFESTGKSDYNGLTVELKKRFRGRFLANLAYTLGKVEDNNPDSVNVVLGGGDDARFPSDPVDRAADLAPGNNDVRHRFVLSGYWDLGYWKDSGGVAKALLDGWSLSWIGTAPERLSLLAAHHQRRQRRRQPHQRPGARRPQRGAPALDAQPRRAALPQDPRWAAARGWS